MPLTVQEWQSADWLIDQALSEDNARHDITTHFFINPNLRTKAVIYVREEGVVSGGPISKAVFKRLDPTLRVTCNVKDGGKTHKNQIIMTIEGRLAPILSAERTALNFLGHLSGVATLTRKFVDQIGSRPVRLFDTRKTTPGWRLLEKYAVRSGGGFNHRHCLKEVVFLKDNHWRFQEKAQWEKGLEQIHKMKKRLIVEVENERQLIKALNLKPNVILFDNCSPSKLKRLCRKARKLAPQQSFFLEASGGVNLRNVRQFAASGIDRISSGALTHAACHLNFSLEIL